MVDINTVVIALFVIVIFLIAVLASAIKIMPEYQRIVIFRLGRLLGIKGPGLVFIIPIIILFQPEFRRALLRLGQNPVFSMFLKSEQQEMTYEIIQAVENLSKSKIGALIGIERDIGLGNLVRNRDKITCRRFTRFTQYHFLARLSPA